MSPLRALVALVGAAVAAALVALSIVHVLAPQRDGLLALTQILAPYLFLVLLPFVVLLRSPGASGRLLRWGVAAALLVFVVRFVPGWVSLPGSAPAAAAAHDTIRVATWNLELGQPPAGDVVARLRELDADVVGLVELTPAHADAIRSDPVLASRYGTMELRPTEGSLGIGLLSTYRPTGVSRRYGDPPILVQQLETASGGRLTVVTAHPLPAAIRIWGDVLPIDYDSTSRDRHLARVRAIVDPILASGVPLLLVGDFNVVDREPGYDDLATGLIDAHRAVGLGPGHTWRPGRLEWLPFGLLRIDYLFSANGVTPRTLETDCTPSGSDHCLVVGEMALPRPG